MTPHRLLAQPQLLANFSDTGEAQKILVVKKAEAEAESKALQGQGIAGLAEVVLRSRLPLVTGSKLARLLPNARAEKCASALPWATAEEAGAHPASEAMPRAGKLIALISRTDWCTEEKHGT